MSLWDMQIFVSLLLAVWKSLIHIHFLSVLHHITDPEAGLSEKAHVLSLNEL